MGSQTLPEPLDLNHIVGLSQDKQLLPILTWLSECESYLLKASADELSQNQQALQRDLLNILSLPSPRLGHVLRRCLGRCFAHLFERGDKKVLFDTASTLAQKIAQIRADKETKQKQYRPSFSVS
jgi:HEAT repeat-containing protein 5